MEGRSFQNGLYFMVSGGFKVNCQLLVVGRGFRIGESRYHEEQFALTYVRAYAFDP